MAPKTQFPANLLTRGAGVQGAPVRGLPTAALRGALDRSIANGEATDPYTAQQRHLAAQGRAGQQAGPVGMGPPPERVHEAGGDLVAQLLHPDAFTTVERVFRSLPEDGMFSPAISHDNPFQFELGIFKVPKMTNLWLSDYSFGTMLFDGVNAGDFSEAPPTRFSGSMGFDVLVNATRIGNIEYELDPVPIVTNRQAFNPNPTQAPFNGLFGGTGTDAAFSRAAANSFATTAASGLATLPARRQVQGPENRNPWTWVVGAGQRVSLSCIIFRPIQEPLAAIFGRLAGHVIHEALSLALINRVRPT